MKMANDTMIRKTVTGKLDSVNDSTMTIRHVITSLAVDRDGEVVVPKGMHAENFKQNPVVLFAHNYRDLPIGKNVSLEVTDKEVIAETQFADTELGRELFQLYKNGFMNAWSIGFRPIKVSDKKILPNQKGATYEEWELLEYSAVPVPSNPQALTVARSKGLNVDAVEKYMDNEKEKEANTNEMGLKGVIPYKKHPLAPESAPWDAGKEVAQATPEQLKEMCAWYDTSKPDVKSSYKLPHHYVRNFTTVWRGVAAAMAALLGARGGVNIPDADKKGVYNHLAKHYAEFNKTPPEFHKYASDEEIFKACGITEEEFDTAMLRFLSEAELREKSGRVISEKNRKKLEEAVKAIDAAESALESVKTALSELIMLSEPNKPSVDGSGKERKIELTKRILEELRKTLAS